MTEYKSILFNQTCLILLSFFLSGCYEKQSSYNILFIAVDDLRPELGIYGEDHVRSPEIDGLAEKGTLFNRAYCSVSWCAPSRTSLMTGMHPDRTGVMDLTTHFRDNIPDVITLPQFFKKKGYISLGFGKLYHNSPDMQDSLSWSTPCWIPPVEHPILAYATEENKRKAHLDPNHKSEITECADVPDEAYPDGMITKQALEALRRLNGSDKPFFLGVGYYKPHLPFTAPAKYWDMYDPDQLPLAPVEKLPQGASSYIFRSWSEPGSYSNIDQPEPYPDSLSRHLVHGYLACISFIDAQIGKLKDELKRLNLTDNTIIVIWGDHGWKLGEFGRWSKHSVMEIDTRVPLIIYIPGKPSRKIDHIVESIDIYPTLAELTGFDPPEAIQGENMFNKTREYALSRIPRDTVEGVSIRTPEYRYTEWRIKGDKDRIITRELYRYTEHDFLEKLNLIDDPVAPSVIDGIKKKVDF